MAELLKFELIFDCLAVAVRGLMEATEFFEPAGLVHFLSRDEEGMLAGGYGHSGKVLSP